jgi:methylated-DNA-protein-cysteine methyltransferase-like protein
MEAKQGLSNYDLIWETVRQIPRGRVATYGEVAEQAGVPGQARLVGYALHNLPAKSDVPWHRVINSQGRISLPRGNSGYQRQMRLLRKEGVRFAHGRVDLARFGWLRALRKRK